MSQALRKLTAHISKSKACTVFINQIREKVGIVYGNPETTTGGRALKFYSSIRIEVRRSEAIKQGTNHIGNRTKAKIVKNKVAPPFKLAEFDIMFGTGISKEGDLLDIATAVGIVQKSGSWYSYEGERMGQGRENAKEYIKNNQEFCSLLETKLREIFKEKDDKDNNKEEA
ncbi:MAG: DNA recombination/repair protein RecA, partial [Clostridiaceae bacterium]|nr:DNA recombination/repair protein RecA [Clostridiaceae bacterium]